MSKFHITVRLCIASPYYKEPSRAFGKLLPASNICCISNSKSFILIYIIIVVHNKVIFRVVMVLWIKVWPISFGLEISVTGGRGEFTWKFYKRKKACTLVNISNAWYL